jgi:uncharacterized protein YeaO (DUF488 family)
MQIRVERIYGSPTVEKDEIPLLVDRLWPRGLSKESVPGLRWMKEWAPSATLRQWFHAHPEEFATFRERYLAELSGERKRISGDLAKLESETGKEASGLRLLLLYGARDPNHNNALVLRDYLASLARPRPIP